MNPRVTLKALAQTLGLSTQAVSLALRGQRGVSEATRERVKQEAARVGYAPDPGLRALADYRSMTREGAGRWKRVALVNNWPGPKALQEDSFYRLWKEELKKALRERGIALEDHWLGAEGEHTASVFRQLWHRGITGVFVAPPAFSEQPPALDLPRDRFEIVTFGPGHLFPDFHCVQFDFYENLRLAWKHLWQRGHRRIGLVYWEKQGWRTDHAWPAAFHIEQKLSGVPAGQLQPLILTTSALQTGVQNGVALPGFSLKGRT
jgi:LacI family transcriptional regulator